jgi:hypothetical protein
MKIKLFLSSLLISCALIISAQDDSKQKSLDIYGFVMTDAGYNFGQMDPNWFDVLRTSKMPAYKNQFGTNGNAYFSVRQTRFGVKSYNQTPLGELKTIFEFELFGTGVDAGQTTIRLRHAYGELGKWGVGQYWSPFMDIDVFPNTVEYWGPAGMVFFRNVQIRYMPIQGDTRLTFALERPGASSDQGVYADRIELQNVRPRFRLPDFSGEYRYGQKWGYVEIAGILRSIGWEDQNNNPNYDLSDTKTGWGLNLSTNINIDASTIFRGQFAYGEGIENYMNEGPADIGVKANPGNPQQPAIGVPLPVTGIVAFVEHNWNEKFSTAAGYSYVHISNTEDSDPSQFKTGNYVIGNLIYMPVPKVMAVVELQYGTRDNFTDGYSSSATKIQFSFKYNFSYTLYGEKK